MGKAGKVWVYSGAQLYAGLVDDVTPLYEIEGVTGARLGSQLVPFADFNGDGVPDFAVSSPGFKGAWTANLGSSVVGTVTVHSGPDGAVLQTYTGQTPGDGFGAAAAPGGDMNDDGRSDLLIGAPCHQAPEAQPNDYGRTYAFLGVVPAGLVQSGAAKLVANPPTIETCTATPQTVTFKIDGGLQAANQMYVLVTSTGGTKPGTQLPGFPMLPINLDSFTWPILNATLAASPPFGQFLGILDASGKADVSFGPLPPAILPASFAGLQITVVAFDPLAFTFVTQPVTLDVIDEVEDQLPLCPEKGL
jgi:hypothetical protein